FAFSAALNAARDADDIVAAIAGSGLVEAPALITLSAVEVDDAGQPRWLTIAAQWDASSVGSVPEYRPGERFHVPDIDIAGAWAEGGEPLIIEDVTNDERVGGMLLTLYGRMRARAAALMP